ncbi:carbohydrate kinase family protein [Thermococcus sp.]
MIVSLGEVLIDMIALEDKPLAMVEKFERHPGGAPANVAVGLSRLKVESALVSKVGKDPFGDFLIEALKRESVKPLVARDEQKHTGVVFVQLIGAKPEFILYDGVAYFNLQEEDVPVEILKEAEAVHFGTVAFAREPSRKTIFGTLKKLKGKTVLSYDVNIRLDLWRGREEEMLDDIKDALKLADIVKLGWEEYRYLAEKGVAVESFRPKVLAITLGSKGSLLISGRTKVDVPAIRVKALDTTGAGDAFMAGLLAGLHYSNAFEVKEYEAELLERLGRFANLVAGLSVTRRGAWSVPRLEEIEKSPEFLMLGR